MKRFSTILAAGLLGAGLWLALPATARAQTDETIDINLNNARINGNLNLGIGQAGSAIGNKVAQIGKPATSNVPTIPGTAAKKATTKSTSTTKGNTNTKGNQDGHNWGRLGQMIGNHGGEHREQHDKDHGRRSWDTHGHEHGGSMIGSLQHHREREREHDRHFAFNGDHRQFDGKSGMKQSGSANTKSNQSATKKATQVSHLNNGNTKNLTKAAHSATAGAQIHHTQHPPAMHGIAAQASAHSGKTGRK